MMPASIFQAPSSFPALTHLHRLSVLETEKNFSFDNTLNFLSHRDTSRWALFLKMNLPTSYTPHELCSLGDLMTVFANCNFCVAGSGISFPFVHWILMSLLRRHLA